MVGEISVSAHDGRFTRRQVLRFEIHSISSNNESRFRLGGRRACLQRSQRLCDLPRFACSDVDVIGLEHTPEIRLV